MNFINFNNKRIIFREQQKEYIDKINKLIIKINKLTINNENNSELIQLLYQVDTNQIENLIFNTVKLNSEMGEELNNIDISSNIEFYLLLKKILK